ncbi:RICIN domain-containing protein [Paraburkholderia sp. BR14374]
MSAISTTPGASVIEWTCNGQNNELWTLTQNNGLCSIPPAGAT